MCSNFSCTVAKLDIDVLKNAQFSLPGGCTGMKEKYSDDKVIKSATYVNNNDCEAYFTMR